MSMSPEECAHEVLETVLLLMHSVYAEVKSRRTLDLSVSQFRALSYLELYPGASLSEVAEHLAIALPSASKLADILVEGNLVARQTSRTDRRRITLTLTAQGTSMLQSVRQRVQAHMAERVAALPEAERGTVIQAMRALRSVFARVQRMEAGTAQGRP